MNDLHTGIRLRRGIVRAVDGITFSVEAGETVGLVGESGCGKTMTGMSIMRLLPPGGHIDGGSIVFGGRDLAKLGEDAMRKVRGDDIGMVFQDPMTSLNPTMTVGRQISEVVLAHRDATKAEATERAAEVLRLVGMPKPKERLSDYPHQLSGGLRQRVMIAMALACDPKLLIADEPTTALDVTIQAQILTLLDDLKSRLSMSMLLVTHDMGVIAGRTDRVMVMYAGRIVETARTEELFVNPHHPYTEALLASIPKLDQDRTQRLYSIPGVPPDLVSPPRGCRFAPRCRYAQDDCRENDPPLAGPDPAHLFACFHPVNCGPVSASGPTPGIAGGRTSVFDGPDGPEGAVGKTAVRGGTPLDAVGPAGWDDVTTGPNALDKRQAPAPPRQAPASARQAPSPAHQAPEPARPTPEPARRPVPEPARPWEADTAAGASLLELVWVSKEFPVSGSGLFRRNSATVKAVTEVSLSLTSGETLGLVGESGCGKTTVGRMAVGLERPTEGQVLFAGDDLATMRAGELRRRRRDLQLMFQDPYASLDPRMRVGSIVAEPLAIQGVGSRRERETEVARLLGEVGLSPAAASLYPHEFSGGQRQRIGLARALALKPKLIVADEPVSALDVSIRSQILNLMKALQEAHGLTYLVISHDLSVVRYVADRIGVMYLGRLVEIGSGSDIYEHPAHPYTAALLETVPVPDPAQERSKRRAPLGGELPSPVDPPSGCRFRTRCPRAQDLCAEEVPPLRDFGRLQRAACHFPLQEPVGSQAVGAVPVQRT